LDIVNDQPELPIPFGSVHPSESAVIIQAAAGGGARLELIAWGWTPYSGKGLVINVQSEKRNDPPRARGIAPISRFYEFLGAKAPKEKFEFSPAVNDALGFAVAIKDGRFALMTTEPGPDVHGIHSRMPVTLRSKDWRRFLTDPTFPRDLTTPAIAGTLKNLQIR
jgi:putative SOS response-associated peptidase YedK